MGFLKSITNLFKTKTTMPENEEQAAAQADMNAQGQAEAEADAAADQAQAESEIAAANSVAVESSATPDPIPVPITKQTPGTPGAGTAVTYFPTEGEECYPAVVSLTHSSMGSRVDLTVYRGSEKQYIKNVLHKEDSDRQAGGEYWMFVK